MGTLKRTVCAAVALLVASYVTDEIINPPIGRITDITARAASVPTFGPQVQCIPQDIQSCINQLVNSINANVNGMIAWISAPVTTAGTGVNTIITYSMPGGLLMAGDALHVKAWGVNDGNANARTMILNFGTTACTVTVTGTSALWDIDAWVQNLGTVASPVQTVDCKGQQGTTAILNAQPTNSTQNVTTAATTVTLTATAATAGTMTISGAWIEMVR
jgi:hypothetical protein